jgi:hypothetical protein
MVRELLAVTVAQDLTQAHLEAKQAQQHFTQAVAVAVARQAVLVVLVVAVIEASQAQQTPVAVVVLTQQQAATTERPAVRE